MGLLTGLSNNNEAGDKFSSITEAGTISGQSVIDGPELQERLMLPRSSFC